MTSKRLASRLGSSTKASDPMHLKLIPTDLLCRLLRTGAANFSASGLKRQDNDFDRD